MSQASHERTSSDRRRFLQLTAGTTLGLLAPGVGTAAATARPRALSFYDIHTREALEGVVYWQDGHYVPRALSVIDHQLRDFRTDEIKPIDVRLLDLLHALNDLLGNRHPLHVISGYRSPRTNAMLARRSNAVAKNSYHVKGRAIDIRVPAYRLPELREAALTLHRGGVGYYPDSNFVHVDTGPVRAW